MRKSEFLSRHTPPGADLHPQWRVLSMGGVVSWLYSLGFIFRFADAWSQLYSYDRVSGKRVLQEGVIMPDFIQLLDNALLGFGLLAIVMIGFCIFYYTYHRQGSRSIYLMRRLPDRWELHRRCLSLPLLTATLCIAAAALLLLLYYGIYCLATPESCLRPGQWQMIWGIRS